jgi:transposase
MYYLRSGFEMGKNVTNAKLEHRINRRGGTSPFLVCVELNPGPKRKATRRCAKKPRVITKKPKINEFEKGQIAMGIDNGLTRCEIARQLNRGKSAIQLWADRHEKEGRMERKSGSGRPRITTQGDDRFLLIQSKKNRKRTAVDLRRTITNKDGKLKASVHAIRRRRVKLDTPHGRQGKSLFSLKNRKNSDLNGRRTMRTGQWSSGARFCGPMNHRLPCFHDVVIGMSGGNLEKSCGRIACLQPSNMVVVKLWFGVLSMHPVLES